MKIHDFAQYSPDWWSARRGKVTASNMGRIITAKTMKLAAAHEDYVAELVADSIRLDPPFMTEKPVSRAMARGTEVEPEARRWLAFECNLELQEVGGCETDDGRLWASPDALILNNGEYVGGLELKVPEPKTHVSYLLTGKIPPEYMAQCHGSLIVTGLPSWKFCSYCPSFPTLIVDVTPNLFTEALKLCLDEFIPKYDAALETIRGLS